MQVLGRILISLVLMLGARGMAAAPVALGDGVIDHGVAAPVAMTTWGNSVVATQDAQGRRQVFIKLWGGGDASYLFIDAETGQSQQVNPGGRGWGAYLVHVGADGTIYDTMGRHMVAINPATRQVRRLGEIPSGMALSFVSDEAGVVYAGIYPSATLVSYDPRSGVFKNHGALNEEKFPQYLRPLAIDQAGWIYGGVSILRMQVLGFNPATGEKRAFIPEAQRRRGNVNVFRSADGKVYANAEGWGLHELTGGEARPVTQAGRPESRPTNQFADGSRIVRSDVPDRQLMILDAGAKTPREVKFDYQSAGVNIYTIVDGPDGKIYGATGVPLRIWGFDPENGQMWERGLGDYTGHVNQFARLGDKLYGAIYSLGGLIEFDPRQPYEDGSNISNSKNPRLVHAPDAARDLYGRPHAVLAHPDGRHVLMGGNAQRAMVGSGLLIYDTQTGEEVVLDRPDLVRDQGINALVGLPGGDVLVGTTTEASTGGIASATAAMVYRLDLKTRKITGRWTLEPATRAVRDLILGPDGLVYGLAEGNRLFVFDPKHNEFVHDAELTGYGRVSGGQAPRSMALGPDGKIYALFREAVVQIDPGTGNHRAVARPGVPINAGVAIQGGRIYFSSGARLLSAALPGMPTSGGPR